jgi:flagellar hook assembly protein FlgD
MVNPISSQVKLAPGQTPFTKELRSKTPSIDAMEKEFSKIEDDMLKLILKHMEFPPMDGEKSQQADTLGPIVTAQNAKLSMMNARVIAKSAEVTEKSSLLQRSSMCGQKVHVDDSVRNFSGKSANFAFNITGQKIPERAMIQGNIIIKDSDDNIVFRKKMTNLLSGKNSFIWDGKGLDGKTVPHGSYKIEVEAYYTEGANENRIALNASSVKEGEIEKVDIQNGELILKDGTKVDMDSVKFVSGGDKSADKKSEAPPAAIDYNSYIGKTVDIEQNTVKYSGRPDAPITFLSDVDLKDADVQIHFYKNGKYIAMDMKRMDLKKGQNFVWLLPW